MKPVLEFVKRHSRYYTYSIRASQVRGVTPEVCYVDQGHISLAACIFDAAQALSLNFPEVRVRYQGICMGELHGEQLARCAQRLAAEWMLADEDQQTDG